jgi:hypothetical protein
MFLILYEELTNVPCVSLLSHDRYQHDSAIQFKTDLGISSSTVATSVVMCYFCQAAAAAAVVLPPPP